MDVSLSISIIFFSIVLIILCSTIILLLFIQKKNIAKTNNGIFLVDIDLKNNRLRKSDLVQIIDKDANRNNNTDFFAEGWMDISDFLLNLSSKNQEKILNAFDAIKINKKYVKFVLKNEIEKDSDYYMEWDVELFQTKKEISATIKWSRVKKMPKGLKIITKEELFRNTNKYKSFIAFNLRSKNPKTFKNFIAILFESLKIKNLDFFVSKNIVILIIYGNESEIVQKNINQIIKRYEKIKTFKNLEAYCDSIAVVESKNLFDSKDLVKIINRIHFSLIKSTQLNKIFYFNAKNIFFNEFEEFKENYLLLNNIIKNKEMQSIKLPIKDYKNNNNVIAHYIKPNIEYPINFWTEMIVNKANILPNIEDEFFKNTLSLFKDWDQYLIDVNDYIILQNINKLKKLSKIVFIIKFLESTNIQNFELITSTLKTNGIKFGIKIENIVPEVITIIESIMPHAIIIDESLIDTNDLRKFLLLKQLVFLCNKNPATLIYQNPSELELSNKIINYYFHTE